MRRSGRIGWVAVAVASVALAACGSDNSGGSAAPPSEATTAAAALTSASAASTAATGASTTAAGAATTAATAGGVDLASLADAARKEGAVNVYGISPPALMDKLSTEFEKAYGVKIVFTRLTTADLTPRYSSEAEAGAVVADVVVTTPDSGTFTQTLQKGWTVPLDQLGILPADYPPNFVIGDQGVAVISLGLRGIGINTDAVKTADAPDTWDDLADPKWQGKLLMDDPADSKSQTSSFSVIQRDYGDAVIEGFGKNVGGLYNSVVPLTEALAAGEGSVALFADAATAKNLQASGAPVEVVFPTEAVVAVESAVGVSKDAPHPAAAKLLAAYLLTKEGQVASTDPSTGSVGPVANPDAVAQYRRPDPVSPEAAQKIYDLLNLN